jgi:probable rRNA maturation factor
MISITNTQRRFTIKIGMIKKATQAMLNELGYSQFDIGILFCGTTAMAQYNGTYRNKHTATDVLSFPYHTTLKAGEVILPATPDDANLGDMILCPIVIDKKRHDWSRSFDDHCLVLVAHGMAHLLGHDHEIDSDYLIMQKLEDRLLEAARHNL